MQHNKQTDFRKKSIVLGICIVFVRDSSGLP